eukprot:Polyplicarium_translucidae@DN2423_c1_g1_i1.p2
MEGNEKPRSFGESNGRLPQTRPPDARQGGTFLYCARRLGGRFSPLAFLSRRAVSLASVHHEHDDIGSPAVRAAREVREFVRSYHRVWSSYTLITEVLHELRRADTLPHASSRPPLVHSGVSFDPESYIDGLVSRTSGYPESPLAVALKAYRVPTSQLTRKPSQRDVKGGHVSPSRASVRAPDIHPTRGGRTTTFPSP